MSKSAPTLSARTLSLCWMLGGLALTACAKPQAALIIPPTAAEPCQSPAPQGVVTVKDLALFSLKQEEALLACEAKRKALIEVIAEP